MSSVLTLIRHYQSNIEKHPDDEKRVLRCLDKLHQLGVTVAHLQETGVGRTVNSLRKEPGHVGTAARAIVAKWKYMVANEESSGNDQDHNTDSSHEVHSDNETITSPQSEGFKSNIKLEYDNVPKIFPNSQGYPDSQKRSYDEKSADESNKRIKLEKWNGEGYDLSLNEKKILDTDKYASRSSNDKDYKIEQRSSSSHSDNNQCDEDSHTIIYKKQSGVETTKDKSDSHHRKEKSRSHKHSDKSEYKQDSSNENLVDTKTKDQKDAHKSIKPESSSDKYRSKDKHREDRSKEKNKHEEERMKHKKDEHKQKSNEKYKETENKHKRDEKSASKSNGEHNSSKHDKHSHTKSRENEGSLKDKCRSESTSKHEHRDKRSQEKHKSRESSKSLGESSHSSKQSSSKYRDDSRSHSKNDIPKKKHKNVSSEVDLNEGVGCDSGASFAEALGMVLSPVKSKKKLDKESKIKDSLYSPCLEFSPAAMLSPNAKLPQLPPLEISALPEISPHYKPRPPPKLLPGFMDDESLSQVMTTKNQRTKVYSGTKKYGVVPLLTELCKRVLQENIDALEYTGGVPYELLKPVVDSATPDQLFQLEHFNPYLMEETDHLWRKHCEKSFRNQRREEMETWREMYLRCKDEREAKLRSLTENIKMTQEVRNAPVKQTKMAYVDSIVKPPRNVARKQAVHGTARVPVVSPAARVAALANSNNVLKAPESSGLSAIPSRSIAIPAMGNFLKPKKAPLMQKALQFMRGKKR